GRRGASRPRTGGSFTRPPRGDGAGAHEARGQVAGPHRAARGAPPAGRHPLARGSRRAPPSPLPVGPGPRAGPSGERAVTGAAGRELLGVGPGRAAPARAGLQALQRRHVAFDRAGARVDPQLQIALLASAELHARAREAVLAEPRLDVVAARGDPEEGPARL